MYERANHGCSKLLLWNFTTYNPNQRWTQNVAPNRGYADGASFEVIVFVIVFNWD